ncbi:MULTISPECIES: DUF177 domain-containing protein [unclassified Paenibacillus]|uniref:YceD family protein n=1 Tax=unclassified Paenibacillus TaxID=185978 RepID=UPI001AEA9044|nr:MULTISPECIES: DUF177 domain-containing protein [unclassified Paenibacillus]MBP1156054.1 uncharacterized protein [Paenibacillus sp. PvP091]MBP1168560.1 uncharacterized protein [Paenibacillus sp. PvR098]MBP2439588.1 uncharacterized protein [Paenibacillus sp. PvP052]
MFIHLKDLAAKGTMRLEGTEDLTEVLPKSGSLLGCGPLHVRLDAQNKAGGAEVSGELEIDVEQACSRCLAPVAEHLTIPFHETFVKGEEKALEASDDEEENVEDVLYVSEDRIELEPYLVESVMLAMPFIPLCSEDCQGLCPVCGTNKNEQACGCKQDKVDPRLAGLADFFKDQS